MNARLRHDPQEPALEGSRRGLSPSSPSLRRPVFVRRFLTPFSAPVRDALLGQIRQRNLRKGDVLFQQGDPHSYVHLIERGGILLVRSEEAGREFGLDWLGPGGVCGLEELFVGGPHAFSGRATTRTEVSKLPAAGVHAALIQEPLALVMVARYLAAQLRSVELHSESVALSDVGERLRRILRALAMHAVAENRQFLDIDQTDLAALAAASRQSVNRHLSELRRQGTILVRRNRIVLCDSSMI